MDQKCPKMRQFSSILATEYCGGSGVLWSYLWCVAQYTYKGSKLLGSYGICLRFGSASVVAWLTALVVQAL